MSIHNKQFQYGGHTFNIKVELNHLTDRNMDGKRAHLIVVNDIGQSNYYKTSLCEAPDLEKTISLMEAEAKKWVDSLKGSKSQDELILRGLGFIKS